jgi:hypothetical protein
MPLSTSPANGKDFEQQVELLLEQLVPNCFLPGVPVFRADAAMAPDSMANELDFILHLQKGRRHQLLIIECKSCRVTGRGDGRGNFAQPTPSSHWIAHYPRDKKEKSIKDQLRAQRQALLTNLEPLEGEVRIHAIVVGSQIDGIETKPGHITTQELPSFELSLVRAEHFEQFLGAMLAGATVLRVQQSEILRRIRQGQPVPALGHPEIYNAIEYTRRCRAFIDSEIFRHLDLRTERWAINGSAGMGKSVLLIYVTMVLITDRTIDALRDGTRFLQSYAGEAARLGLAELEKRRVWVLAHTEKQRNMLERMFERFNELYGEVDSYNEFRRVKPEFHVFSEVTAIDCNVLLVDEAHDLGKEGEKRVRDWHESAPGNYLIIACDRHQKLRLSQDETRMIDGVSFSLRTKKLSRNYRNPFPAYAGSLGLLFRWFAATGPKTMPTPKELRDEFGFGEVVAETPEVWSLRSRNDAHPANNWSHTVSTFLSADAAYRQLSEFPLRKEHVLWVRFSPEENEFNYEKLQFWSYHSVYGSDASDLLDKYVKGQEFPVVVIEGVPDLFSWENAIGAQGHEPASARVKMWQARRQVYLAASRANVFLYFILPTAIPADVRDEFALMFRQLARPPVQTSPSGKLWEIRVAATPEAESFASYVDAIEAEPASPPAESPTESAAAGRASVPSGDKPREETGNGRPASTLAEKDSELREPAIGGPGGLGQAGTPPIQSPPPPPEPPASQPPPLTSATTIAPSTSTGPVSRKTPPSLGAAAPLTDVADSLGCDVVELIEKMAAKGFPKLQPSSKVNVAFATQIHGSARSPSTVSATSLSSLADLASLTHSAQVSSTQQNRGLSTHGGSAVGEPQPSIEQTVSVRSESRETGAIRLHKLAAQMQVSPILVVSFLEAQGTNCKGANPLLSPDDVAKMVTQLVGDRGIGAFAHLAKTPIKTKALANHLGLRPHVVARDLMQDKLLLTTEDHVPFDSMVRLCHFYRKQLPPPPGPASQQS